MQLVQTNGVKSAYCWHLAIYDLIDYANAFNFGLNSFVNIYQWHSGLLSVWQKLQLNKEFK